MHCVMSGWSSRVREESLDFRSASVTDLSVSTSTIVLFALNRGLNIESRTCGYPSPRSTTRTASRARNPSNV
jgi:hypothetical protein